MRSSVGILPASLAIRSVAVPARLRPTAPIAPEAILVGDPGRALLLAQELLEQPKMSNHARGLWGYSGSTPEGRALTIQSTGIGGPSAALVLADLAELGVRRAIRVGTCVALDEGLALGQLLVIDEAIAVGGSAAAFGAGPGASLTPDEELTAGLCDALGDDAMRVAVASFDDHPPSSGPEKAVAADMQSAPLLARARELGVGVAALLIAAESVAGDRLAKDVLEDLEKTAGRAATRALLSP
jgi:purine-nucleoside phosphorylase